MPPTDEARAQRSRLSEQADRIESDLAALGVALAATDRTARKAKRLTRRLIVALIVALIVVNVRTFLDERHLRHTQATVRSNTCANDSLWLEVIAAAPPSATVTKFRARFEADYAANRCGR